MKKFWGHLLYWVRHVPDLCLRQRLCEAALPLVDAEESRNQIAQTLVDLKVQLGDESVEAQLSDSAQDMDKRATLHLKAGN